MNVTDKTKGNRSGWFGRVESGNYNEIVDEMDEIKIKGKRRRGRQKKSGRKVIREDERACGVDKEMAEGNGKGIKEEKLNILKIIII